MPKKYRFFVFAVVYPFFLLVVILSYTGQWPDVIGAWRCLFAEAQLVTGAVSMPVVWQDFKDVLQATGVVQLLAVGLAFMIGPRLILFFFRE